MRRFLLLLTMLLATAGASVTNAQDIATGLVRVKSKRTSYYLSTAQSGAATTTAKNLNKLDQVWVLQTSGSGYTFRSANTGEYLQADYATPASGKTTLYIRKSPNATGSQVFYNISSDSGFSGKSFLNTNSGHGLFNYSMDDGCDWYLEAVENFTEDEIKERILGASPYAGELKDGAYYQVVSYYDLYLTAGSDVSTKILDEENFAQYWQLHKSGSGWLLQSVLTENYVGHQTQTSTPYHMGAAKTVFNIARVADDWDYRWTISVEGESAGLHDASTQGHNVVYWSTTATASEWHFVEVELSEADIEAARAGQNAYEDLVKNKAKLQTNLNNLFQDKACTVLKEEIQALSDEALAENADYQALNSDMQKMVLKVKNDTWQQFTNATTGYTAGYEKFFRVADYGIYSHDEEMANGSNFTMSNSFGRLSGPTGIAANPGDIIYIYVNANPRSTAELFLEAVSTDGVAGNHSTGEQTALKQGLNLFRFSDQKILYVLHRIKSGTTGNNRLLDRYSDITIHIEGGQLNGYWDATRNMTNADWKLMQQDMLKAPFINLKTKHLVFQLDRDLLLAAEPNEIEGLTRIWEQIPTNEDRYMGVEDFEGRYNNIWNVFSGASSYMHSTTRGTWYTESTIPTVMNYANMRKGGNLWGPSHEIGHNHQGSINVIGSTESSNNMFSNINTFEQGVTATRREGQVENFKYLAARNPWPQRGIWNTTSLFFQLYLYFHAQHHDDQFLPNLFRKMRKNPLNKGTWNGSVTWTSANGETGTGAYVATGAKDYLHLAKMICDVAQADLSEFFEAYGMFEPVNKFHVGDYSNYIVTTTQAEINSAKAYMQKYEKKMGNIMFIDDRVISHPADPDNIFEGLPNASGYRVPFSDESINQFLMKNATSTYVGGDYMLFTDDAVPSNDDYYTLSSNKKTITFRGTNYAGHKFYDQDGNLIYATCKKSETLPARVTDLGIENVRVVTANYDMTDTPCTTEKPDAVSGIALGSNGRTAIYDLTGRRIEKTTKGLYIRNGRKMVIR